MIPSSTIVGRFGSKKHTGGWKGKQIIPEKYISLSPLHIFHHTSGCNESRVERENGFRNLCLLRIVRCFLSTKYLQVCELVWKLLLSTPFNDSSMIWTRIKLNFNLYEPHCFVFFIYILIFKLFFTIPSSFLPRRIVNSKYVCMGWMHGWKTRRKSLS